MIDVDELKRAAAGHGWPSLLAELGGIDAELLDGRPHPCPKCGGTDRFRMVDREAGACRCNQCRPDRCGDGIAALEWLRGWTFKEACSELGRRLSMTATATKNGKAARNGSRSAAAAPDQQEQTRLLLSKVLKVPGTEQLAAAVRQFSERKRGIRLEAVERLKPLLVSWPRREGQPCLAFRGRDTAKPEERAAALVLFRADGEAFPPLGRLDTRKCHLVGGSRESWIFEGEPQSLIDADVILKLEGPTDLMAALSLGLPQGWVAITNANGAKSNPNKLDLSFARGKRAVVLHDRDRPGEEGAARFAAAFQKAGAREVVVPQLPYELAETRGRDLRDWVTEGHAAGDLVALLDAAQPLDVLAPGASQAGSALEILQQRQMVANAVEVPNGEKSELTPLCMDIVLENLQRLSGGWPRRVSSSLFVPGDQGDGVRWLDSADALFGWLAKATGLVEWHRAVGCVGKREVYETLRGHAEPCVAVETMPHFPPLAEHYYAHAPSSTGDGQTLRRLLERFSPATDVDGDLLLAMFVTPAWGGPCGSRPAFLLTAAEGRGVGKSKAAEMVGHLYGGLLDVALNEDIGKLKERLLSADGRSVRVMRLDNIKSMRFSWAELEALLTAPTISGRQLYVGEARRPNVLTTLVTLNGAALSTDMAQRVVPIMLKTPTRSGQWEDETIAFIRENRAALFADMAAFFATEPTELSRYSRWAAWDRGVLARLPDPSEAQRVIAERQGGCDVENEEAAIIQDYFDAQLADLHYGADQAVHLPTEVVAAWYGHATGERRTTTAVTRHLKQLVDERQITRLAINPCRTYGRGFIWRGPEVEKLPGISYDLLGKIEGLEEIRRIHRKAMQKREH